MGAFKELELDAKARKPPATFVVTANAFSEAWADSPGVDVAVGIRPLAEGDLVFARGEAAKIAWRDHPEPGDEANRLDAFNDALMRLAISRGTCDPNNASLPWDVWRGAGDDVVAIALTSHGVKALYDEIERVMLVTSPVRIEATDAQISEIPELATKTFSRMPPARMQRVRRLLSFLHDEMSEYGGE